MILQDVIIDKYKTENEDIFDNILIRFDLKTISIISISIIKI